MSKSLKQDYIDYRIESAKETLKAAKLLADNLHWNSVINRLYYVCFYAISALLYKNDINATSHSGLKHQFTQRFVKTGLIDKELGKAFVKIFDLRQKGDYGDFYNLDKEKTLPYFKPVEKLLERIQTLLNE
jgi:uncharacterized protein (UPF0332 family)